jgi:hypothetical protein
MAIDVLVHRLVSMVHGAAHTRASVTASLVFGASTTSLIDSPDHISHIAPTWRSVFVTTAVLLTITELRGVAVAMRLVRQPRDN